MTMGSRSFEALVVKVGGDISEALEGLDAVGTKAQQQSRRMERAGKRMTAGLTLPILAAGAASFRLASSGEESANKFNVVMGEAADDLRMRLEAMTGTIPLTSTEMERLAAGIQDLLVPMGVARTDAAGMSADMVQLAGDIGSFNDVLPTEVLEAMSSALAGSSEPMRRFGVDTRKTRLEALALEAGLIRQGQALDSTAQAQAVMLAIQRDSTDAIGDAARTVDSAANSVKFLGRNVKQLGINIGAILLPVVTPLIAQASELTSGLAALDPELLAVGVGIAAAAAAIGPLLIAGGKLAGMLALIATPAGLMVAAIAALGTTALVVIKNWDVLALQGALAWTALKDAVFAAVSGILGGLERLPLVGEKFAEMRSQVDAFAEESLVAANERIQELEARLLSVGAAGEQVATAVPHVHAVGEAAAGMAANIGAVSPAAAAAASGLGDLRHGLVLTVPQVEALAATTAELNEEVDRLGQLQGLFGKASSVVGLLGGLGPIGGLLNSGSSILGTFAGLFADGGRIGPGQWGIAGEAGEPEIVTGPATVTPMAQVAPMERVVRIELSDMPRPRNPVEAARDPVVIDWLVGALETAMERGWRPA